MYRREAFMHAYHKRSKIETTYSMVKSLRQEAANFSHLAILRTIRSPLHRLLMHSLLAYWRGL
jgi:hypothetical protein